MGCGIEGTKAFKFIQKQRYRSHYPRRLSAEGKQKGMKSFISYHSSIDSFAGDMKRYLDRYGFNCFLAHDDIPPQAEWIQEIEQNLIQSDLFLPLLTPEYKYSFFCQQETGIAYYRRIEILPILMSEPPMGFIGRYQGIRFSQNNFENSCWKIVKHVAKISRFSDTVIDKILDEFCNSNSYDQAGNRASKILSEFKFTTDQLGRIMDCILENSQIKDSRTARPHVYDFIEEYEDELDPGFIEDYKENGRG
jgi:hypothetical protein